MPWIKHAETRIILFETGSKTHLRHLKVFGFFPRFGGWTFSSLPRFLFYCRDIGNGNSSDLMRGLQSFWAKLSISQILFCSCIKPPYVSMMFFVLFFFWAMSRFFWFKVFMHNTDNRIIDSKRFCWATSASQLQFWRKDCKTKVASSSLGILIWTHSFKHNIYNNMGIRDIVDIVKLLAFFCRHQIIGT